MADAKWNAPPDRPTSRAKDSRKARKQYLLEQSTRGAASPFSPAVSSGNSKFVFPPTPSSQQVANSSLRPQQPSSPVRNESNPVDILDKYVGRSDAQDSSGITQGLKLFQLHRVNLLEEQTTKQEDTQRKLETLERVHEQSKASNTVSDKSAKAYERKRDKYEAKLEKYGKRIQELCELIENKERESKRPHARRRSLGPGRTFGRDRLHVDNDAASDATSMNSSVSSLYTDSASHKHRAQQRSTKMKGAVLERGESNAPHLESHQTTHVNEDGSMAVVPPQSSTSPTGSLTTPSPLNDVPEKDKKQPRSKMHNAMKVLTRNPFKKGDKEKVAKGTPSAPLTPSDDIFSEAPPTTPSSKYFWHGSRKEAKAKEQLALELHLAKQHQQQQFNEEIASLGTKLQQYKSAVKDNRAFRARCAQAYATLHTQIRNNSTHLNTLTQETKLLESKIESTARREGDALMKKLATNDSAINAQIERISTMESAVLTWEKKQSEYEQTLRGYLDTAVEIKDGLHARANTGRMGDMVRAYFSMFPAWLPPLLSIFLLAKLVGVL